MEERKKRRGDRRDGYWLNDLPGMTQFTPYIYPNRADNEAYINLEIDLRPIDAYLAKKNDGLTTDKYTYFHVVCAAIAKAFVLRPKMNRFVAGNRVYARKYISMAFVVKKRFEDQSEEGLAFRYFDQDSTIDTLHASLVEEIHQLRRGDVKDNSTEFMDKLVKLPRFVLRLIMKILFFLDRRGIAPYSLVKTDPNYASIFLSNLGSINLECGYHHLNNWGTNSCFVVIGRKHMKGVYQEDGSVDVHPVLPLGITLDERIADGYYYSKTVALVKELLANPELLEQPASTPVEYAVHR